MSTSDDPQGPQCPICDDEMVRYERQGKTSPKWECMDCGWTGTLQEVAAESMSKDRQTGKLEEI